MTSNNEKFQDGEAFGEIEVDKTLDNADEWIAEITQNVQGLATKADLSPSEFLKVAKVLILGNKGPINDRAGGSEAMVAVMASLPSTAKLRTRLTNKFIDSLWEVLQHPPLSYVGGDVQYDVVKNLKSPNDLPAAIEGMKGTDKVVFKFPEFETTLFKVDSNDANTITFTVPGTEVELTERVPKAPDGLFQYRMPDGSFNNILEPHLGRAGTPYAKSVRPDKRLQGVRPDPALLFDTLMARDKEKFKPNAAGISSMLFYHASIIIHDVFRTNRKDPNISDTSSYLDLAPLYGSSLQDQHKVRTMKEGKLKPDTFHETRLLAQPAGTNIMLVLYNRFHNHVAEHLLKINEGGRFTLRPDYEKYKDLYRGKEISAEQKDLDDAKALAKQDHDLFNTARLVVGGMYINVSLHDYLRAITNSHSIDTDWTLDPRVDITKQFDGEGVPRGIGNQVSVEFNLLYRFHSCISQKDEKWTEDFFRENIFKGKKTTEEIEKISMHELWPALMDYSKEIGDLPAEEREFAGLKRDPVTGKFNDADLAKALHEAMNDPAGSFGARTIPKSLRIIEIMGIMQARKWQVASLNEFRDFFGLKRYDTFQEINKDPEIAAILEKLYVDPDMVEMYPGLMIEDVKPPRSPGSGICPTYSLGKAILSDAITLVRSDRFNTIDYNVANLTSWGFNEAQYDVKTLGGSMLYKLIHRGLPGWFPFNSVAVMQPMYTKKRNIEIADKLGSLAQFNTKDGVTTPPRTVTIDKEALIRTALTDLKNYKAPWVDNLNLLTPGKSFDWFFLAGDDKHHQAHRKVVEAATAKIPKLHTTIHDFIERVGRDLVKKELFHYKKGLDQIDLIRDVAIPLNARLLAELLYLDIKTEENPEGTMGYAEVYRHLLNIHNWGFNNDDPAESWNRRRRAQESVKAITMATHKLVDEVVGGHGFLASAWSMFKGKTHVKEGSLRSCGLKLVEALVASEKDHDKIVDTLWLTAFGNIGSPITTFYEVMEFFLREENAGIWAEIQELAAKDDDEAIHPYVEEAQRLTASQHLTRIAKEQVKLGNDTYEKGTVIHLAVGPAGRTDVLDPKTFNIKRVEVTDKDKIGAKSDVPNKALSTSRLCQHEVLGNNVASTFVAGLVRLVAELKNLHPTVNIELPEEDQGKAKRINSGDRILYLNESWSYLGHDVSSWRVDFDGFIPQKK